MKVPRAACLALALSASAAFAENFPNTWNEVGDAGQTVATAQTPIGTGALEYIHGTISNGADVDMYRITITQPTSFYVDDGANFLSQMFLFSSTGLGIVMADTNAGGGGAVLHGFLVPAPGEYLLAVSAYNNDPLDSAGQMIWNDALRHVEHAPDGTSATNVLDHWNNAGVSGNGQYKLFLKATTYVPAPGAASLLVGAGLVGMRRRRAR